MIRSAVLKLTLYYLGIIMVLCVGFSMVLYHFASLALDAELRSPPFYHLIESSGTIDYEEYRQDRLAKSSHDLRYNLIIFNIGTLILGGALSYVLARQTLRPIAKTMEAQTRFTAAASHELRTPLAALQTEIEIALRSKNINDTDARELFRSNLEEVDKLKTLSEGLLRLARPGDKQQLKHEDVSLRDVAQLATIRLAKAAKAKKISLQNEVKPLLVKGDKQSLTDVAAILIDNAIKYSDPGKTVTLLSEQNHNLNHLIVSDEGKGINASDLPFIFDRFYRSDTARSKSTEGFGLGLSLAKHIVGLHGGTISATSHPGKGSIFTIKLPRAAS